MIRILKSVGIVCLISLAIALLIGRESASSFWTVAGLSAIIQFVLHAIVREVLDLFAKLEIEKIEADQLKAYKDISYNIECPCSIKNVEVHPVDINGETTYDCERCSKKIRVAVAVSTVLVTTPVQALDVNATIKKAILNDKQKEQNAE